MKHPILLFGGIALAAIIVALVVMLLVKGTKSDVFEMYMEKTKMNITVQNGVVKADIWVLPQTEENLKTTLWGTATVAGSVPGESRPAEVVKNTEADTYLIRIIDDEQMYYAVSDVTLVDDCTVQFKPGPEDFTYTVDVFGADGTLMKSYEMFAASL